MTKQKNSNEDMTVGEAMLVLAEMARARGVANVAELGNLPPLDHDTKAFFLAQARAREATEGEPHDH